MKFATPMGAALGNNVQVKLPAEVSMSAGTFVCNHVFYGLMDLAALRGQPFIAGFVHVPRLPQQRDNAKAMALEDIVRGLTIVLEASAQHVQASR